MARRDVEFNAEGVTLRGWFYAAGTAARPPPPWSWRTDFPR
jgi:uncharacterized protein